MMKNIDEHDCIEARVGIWDSYSVKVLDRHLSVLPHKDINPMNRNIRSLLRDKTINHSVPAAYV
jgi:hypothetical protein